jgi:hypothetical protein
MIIMQKNEPFIVTRKEKTELKGDVYIASNHRSENKVKFGIT